MRDGIRSLTAPGALVAFGMVCAMAFPAQADDKSKLPGNCYPDNTSVIPGLDSGKTRASGEAEGRVEEVEFESPVLDTTTSPPTITRVEVRDLGPAEIELNFRAAGVDDENIRGALNVKIEWKNPSATGGVEETKFFTGCAQEIQTEQQSGKLGSFEGEFEGGLVNFPFFGGTIKAGVGSIVVKKDEANPGKIEVDFSLQTGITCFEDNGLSSEDGDIELAKIALTNLSPRGFDINNLNRGAWSFPVGHTADCAFIKTTPAAASRR